MNENQFLSIKPKWMLVKPFKPAPLPADIRFASENGRTGKLGSYASVLGEFTS
jgi:hypothetical protein